MCRTAVVFRLRSLGKAAALGVGCLLLAPCLSASDCIPIHEALQHVGETKCVSGKVLRIKLGAKGVHFLDFCEDQMACPFTVVVFASALKDVGDVRHFEGRTIEIHGAVKLYDGRPEIILNRISQVSGGAAMIPPLPKNYDVENRGHFSAGRLSPTKKPGKTKAKVSTAHRPMETTSRATKTHDKRAQPDYRRLDGKFASIYI